MYKQKESKLFSNHEQVNKKDCVICKQIKEQGNIWFDHEHRTEVLKPASRCYGITNRCGDGEYILFADYDKIYFNTLIKELSNVFSKYKKYLTPFLVLETSPSILTGNGTLGSYHVISFGKLPYQKMREILSFMSVDDDFFNLPKKVPYRANTLRISPKFAWETRFDKETGEEVGEQEVLKDEPRFICWLFEEKNHIPSVAVSQAHLKTYKEFIHKLRFPIIFNRWKLDGLKKIELKQYDSLRS